MLPLASIVIALMLTSAGRAEAGGDSLAVSPATIARPPAPAPWPSTVQVGAPSINSASPDLVDHAGFPALAGVAWDERLEKGPDDRAITVNVTPLALARVVRGDAANGSETWNELLQRVAARVTIGGPPQKIARRNPGRAGRPSNHVTSELKLVLLGDGSERSSAARPTLALALAADNLATGYGLDRYGATLIAERGGPLRWTANAGYDIVERYHAPVRIEQTKLATGVAWRLFGITGRPVELALSGGCLLRTRNSADWQDGAQVNVPITSALRLSAAMRRSERPELPGQDQMREVVSLAYALDGAPR
jgi:hypothetical protein